MKNFTVEEINLMCCFNTSSRKRLIDDMKSVTLNDVDGEIAELMGSRTKSPGGCSVQAAVTDESRSAVSAESWNCASLIVRTFK